MSTSPSKKKKHVSTSGVWMPDKDASECGTCGAHFTVVRRRHHCRKCGLVFCGKVCAWGLSCAPRARTPVHPASRTLHAVVYVGGARGWGGKRAAGSPWVGSVPVGPGHSCPLCNRPVRQLASPPTHTVVALVMPRTWCCAERMWDACAARRWLRGGGAPLVFGLAFGLMPHLPSTTSRGVRV
jgi:hypothetical protein